MTKSNHKDTTGHTMGLLGNGAYLNIVYTMLQALLSMQYKLPGIESLKTCLTSLSLAERGWKLNMDKTLPGTVYKERGTTYYRWSLFTTYSSSLSSSKPFSSHRSCTSDKRSMRSTRSEIGSVIPFFVKPV